MVVVPLIAYWGLALWGLFSARPVLVWLFFGIMPFGSLAVVPTALTGGLSLTGAHMTAMLLILRQFLLHRNGLQQLAGQIFGRAGFILFLFWLWALIVTLFAPRLFAGQIEVVPMALSGFMQTGLLRPTSQNFSQLAYVTVSVFTVFVFARLFRDPAQRGILIGGIMLASALTILTGVLDYLKLETLLSAFRTASYALLTDVSLQDGVERVTGVMPEASSFGNLTMTLLACLYFMRHAITQPAQRRRMRFLLAGLAVMLVMSTSSAGYVGIAVLITAMAGEWFVRASGMAGSPGMRQGLRQELLMVLAILCLVIAVLLAMPALFDPIIARLESMVFSKGESLSYLERSMWTRTAFNAGLESWLIGTGLGSVRASNFAAALFGSTGVLGVLHYFGFVLQRLMQRVPVTAPAGDHAMAAALKWSFLPPFVISLLIGTTPDFGVFEAMRWGALLALTAGVARLPWQRPSGLVAVPQ